MSKALSVLGIVLAGVFFSSAGLAAGNGPAGRSPITIGDLVGTWDVSAHELLIVGGLGAKNVTNSATVEFFSDEVEGDRFDFVNDLGIMDFQADCAVARKGAKISWNIAAETVADFESRLSQAIFDWVAEQGRTPAGLPALDVRSYAYKPIVVIKNTGAPKLGILMVKGVAALAFDDGNGGQTTENRNFKYQCQFTFTSTEPEAAGGE
jgi:hypothetical protein